MNVVRAVIAFAAVAAILALGVAVVYAISRPHLY